jgi:hypothetical protein
MATRGKVAGAALAVAIAAMGANGMEARARGASTPAGDATAR